MRIPTSQIFKQNLANLQKQQTALFKTENQLASGLRISKPSDDPSGAVRVANLDAGIKKLDQYARNIGTAQSALSFEEQTLNQVSNNLQRIRELTVQGNNSTNDATAKSNIAKEIEQLYNELVSLSNTRDASGEYIFAGFKVDTAPFNDNGTTVNYSGDQGQRFIQISDGTKIAMRDTGDQIFQGIPNGDGNINIEFDAANTGTALIGNFGITGNFVQDTYEITFSQATPTSPITYTVTDSSAGVITAGNYSEGHSIEFAGAQFTLSGAPAAGDVIRLGPSQNTDVFSTVRDISTALMSNTPTPTDNAAFHNAMGLSLADLDQAMNNINNARASIGARLNNIDSVENVNLDHKLQLETLLSDTQDLDFAEAISRFNLQMTSLEAAQQAFVKVSRLSLFDYI